MDAREENQGHEQEAAQPGRTDVSVIHAVSQAAGSAETKSKPIRRASSGSSVRSGDKRFDDRLANKKRKKASHRRVLKRTHANG